MDAMKDKEEGDVTLAYTIEKNGKITNIEVVGESAGGFLKRASYRSLRKCKLPAAVSASGRLTVRHRYELVFG